MGKTEDEIAQKGLCNLINIDFKSTPYNPSMIQKDRSNLSENDTFVDLDYLGESSHES